MSHIVYICYELFYLHFVPSPRGEGHIVFGADPICVGVHMNTVENHVISKPQQWQIPLKTP